MGELSKRLVDYISMLHLFDSEFERTLNTNITWLTNTSAAPRDEVVFDPRVGHIQSHAKLN
jgi:hypothetical protein